MHAVLSRNLELVKYQIEEQHFDVNACDNEKESVLMHAITESYNLPIIQYLVEKKANINALNDNNETPLMKAVCNGNYDSIYYLLKINADISCVNKNGQSALHLACLEGRGTLAESLLEKHPMNINEKDNEGCTPLMYVAKYTDSYYAHFQGMKYLLEHLLDRGASVIIKNNAGQTALDIFKENLRKNRDPEKTNIYLTGIQLLEKAMIRQTLSPSPDLYKFEIDEIISFFPASSLEELA